MTTVKVIAVKNRIAELYERIKAEEQKRYQQMLPDNSSLPKQTQLASKLIGFDIDQDTLDAAEGFIANSNETEPLTQKIVGETLITHIPEGGKIPNTLPKSTRETLANENHRQISKKPTWEQNDLEADNKQTQRVKCPACDKTFRNFFSLTIHKRIHYLETDSNVKLAHKCSDCDQLFNKMTQLKQHVEQAHYPQGFICKICDKKLSSLSLLERHIMKVHLERPFNCKQCGKNFSGVTEYEQHLHSHNSSSSVFRCIVCGRKYGSEILLMAHMPKHKQQVPQTCVVCGKRTLRITQHMKIHTPRPKRLLR